MTMHFENQPKPYWNPLFAGLALGTVLLAAFVLTGHGLGVTGLTTRLVAWLGMTVVPQMTQANDYLGGMVEDGKPLSAWITWEVIGLAIGALISAALSQRFKFQLDGKKILGGKARPLTALIGGVAAGFGARVSAGCTSGLGLSGAATLSLAGFTFLITFFIAGLVFSQFMKESSSS